MIKESLKSSSFQEWALCQNISMTRVLLRRTHPSEMVAFGEFHGAGGLHGL